MFIPFTRIISIAMAGVLCFAMLVPLALRRHQPWLAVGLGVLFIAYLAVNVLLWQRMKRRS